MEQVSSVIANVLPKLPPFDVAATSYTLWIGAVSNGTAIGMAVSSAAAVSSSAYAASDKPAQR